MSFDMPSYDWYQPSSTIVIDLTSSEAISSSTVLPARSRNADFSESLASQFRPSYVLAATTPITAEQGFALRTPIPIQNAVAKMQITLDQVSERLKVLESQLIGPVAEYEIEAPTLPSDITDLSNAAEVMAILDQDTTGSKWVKTLEFITSAALSIPHAQSIIDVALKSKNPAIRSSGVLAAATQKTPDTLLQLQALLGSEQNVAVKAALRSAIRTVAG